MSLSSNVQLRLLEKQARIPFPCLGLEADEETALCQLPPLTFNAWSSHRCLPGCLAAVPQWRGDYQATSPGSGSLLENASMTELRTRLDPAVYRSQRISGAAVHAKPPLHISSRIRALELLSPAALHPYHAATPHALSFALDSNESLGPRPTPFSLQLGPGLPLLICTRHRRWPEARPC
jgi:hypothetical protein